MSDTDHQPTYRHIVRMAWPIILANAAVPLLGLADTAVIGRIGDTADLGAIALGSLVFNVVYWTFGFLRMGTTGFVAQAVGADDEIEIRAAIGRPLLMSIVIGIAIIMLQWPITWLSLRILDASAEVSSVTRQYILVRIWAAPATLAMFTLTGALIGLGKTRTLLVVQVFLNGLNIALDVLFAGVFKWGPVGIAAGTAAASWVAALLTVVLLYRILKPRHVDAEPFVPWHHLRNAQHLTHTIEAHGNIMIRTLAMLLAFGWFTRESARFGDVTLAVNHVLLQFVSFIAFFLDGFAFATEQLVGAAVGAREPLRFDRAVRRSSILAFATCVVLAGILAVVGYDAIYWLTDLMPVRDAAASYLMYTVVYVLVAVAAFQLDGIYIGVTRTADMRNAAIASTAALLLVGYPLVNTYGNHGLWIAFTLYAAARGVSLGVLYPRMRRAIV